MSKNLKTKVILAKADFCGHCHAFLPIFKRAIELAKKDKEIVDTEFIIKEMDSSIEPMAHKNFESEYGNDTLSLISGYPTVVILMDVDGEKKIGTVEHTGGDTESAAINFIQNVKNGIKTIGSENKDFYIRVKKQEGGTCGLDTQVLEDKYKAKYIKYKSKYLELLKQNGKK